ncbi:hypothetical protein ACFOKI_14660 [Sphingomonas qilianensis]|uniref:Rod shape-determining protein MreD n=1 Tax=Sphingomonas qilianensis TaxID=1736690 RepID=A0ABU9XMH5_9SPHN
MFRLAYVIALPLLLGLAGGPLLLVWQATPADAGSYAMAAVMGGALGLLVVVANVLGALIVNKIGLRSWAINSALFAGIALACFGFLIDWLDTMLRVIGGITALGARMLPWSLFLLNLLLCCVVHRGAFLPKKVRTVS